MIFLVSGQSGAMPLRVADPVRDLSILQAARRMAQDLVDDGQFDQPEFSALRAIVLSRLPTPICHKRDSRLDRNQAVRLSYRR
ncbi:MAG: hypothetical protein U0936_03595 [Planctomycetaceae bacterium]